ncbi:hypothetical protein ACSLBF_01085 [Pseudoalteromonas sp. T1lg65]|uniref:hypothetical protein n=1 Tax=Pseudoalteromonas sp. T1lg65 TaxID=2077101 RepID=UPI003F7974DB
MSYDSLHTDAKLSTHYVILTGKLYDIEQQEIIKMSKSNKIANASYRVFFQDGDDQIACYANILTGKEYVCINDECLSEKRNLGFKSRHVFTHNEQQYDVTFDVINGFTCETECLVVKDKLIIGRKTSSPFNSRQALTKVLLTFLAGGLVAGVAIFFLGYYLGRMYVKYAL